MAKPPRHRITKMTIGEISAVDDGANEHAMVDLFKAKGGKPFGFKASGDCKDAAKCGAAGECAASGDMAMKKARFAEIIAKGTEDGIIDPETAALAAEIIKENTMDDAAIQKALADAEARLDTLEKANESLTVERDAAVAARDEAVAKAKNDTDEGKTAEEIDAEVLKSLPASVRKRLQDAADTSATLAKMLEKNENDEAISKAKTFGIGKAEDVGGLLVRIAKGKTTPEDAGAFETILKAAAAQAKAGNIFKSLGETVAADFDGEAEGVLKAKVAEIQKAKPGISAAAAEQEVYAADGSLYDAIQKARKR